MKTMPWEAYAIDYHEERFAVGRSIQVEGRWWFSKHHRTYKTLKSAQVKADQLNKEKSNAI